MNHGREITVGITTGCLHETHPRGVIRAARAVAERLVSRDGLRLLAISEPAFDSGELVCEQRELGEWLSENPQRRVDHVEAATSLRRAVRVGRRVLSAVGLKRPGKLAYRIARGVVRRAKPASPPHPPTPPEFISVRDLDAVLSFECYDPIWQWPLESYGCRTVGVFHDAIPLRMNEGAAWRPDEYLRAAGLMALRASVVCCDSRSTRDDLESFFPITHGRTRVVHLGHDTERFREAEPRARQQGNRIAMIGDIETRKNQAGVLRACRHIATAHSREPITLVLIGRPRTPDPLDFLVREASKYVRVERTGYLDDEELPVLLRGCDCFVYPSLWEGFGIPVLEAMSAGVPVVCSDVSSLPEIAGPHAIYCDPYDPVSIANGINRVLAMPNVERAVRTTAACQWASRFTWGATADRFHEVLTEVTASAKRTTA